jgi:hypothetical protein
VTDRVPDGWEATDCAPAEREAEDRFSAWREAGDRALADAGRRIKLWSGEAGDGSGELVGGGSTVYQAVWWRRGAPAAALRAGEEQPVPPLGCAR